MASSRLHGPGTIEKTALMPWSNTASAPGPTDPTMAMAGTSSSRARRATPKAPHRGHRRPHHHHHGVPTRGWTRRCRPAGRLDVHPDLVRLDCVGVEDARSAALDLLVRPDPPTALLTLKTVSTLGALHPLRRSGLDRSVALVGFDDFETADLLQPAVTVVNHDIEQVGRRAATILFDRIAGDDSPIHTVELPTSLIVRGTGELPGPADPIEVPTDSPARPVGRRQPLPEPVR